MPQIDESIRKLKGPKKVLHINNSAFALPDDFEGSIQDAMKLFLSYHTAINEKNKPEIQVDPSGLFSPIGILAVTDDNIKCCVEARIYELDGDGQYVDITPTSSS